MRRINCVSTLWAIVSLLFLSLAASTASAQPLLRDPLGYHILGRDHVKLKDYQVLTPGPGCNIGVNDLGGDFRDNEKGFSMAALTQLAADDCTAAGGTVAQCFCNIGGGGFSVPCQPFPGPILADETDATFIAACNLLAGDDFPSPCTPGATDVEANDGQDCTPASADNVLLNGVCDLKPGSYGTIRVRKQASITLIGGVYNANVYTAEKDTNFSVTAASTLNVCGADDLRFGDSGSFNSDCGLLRVNYAGTGEVNLGVKKLGVISMDVCAPFGNINMRRSNSLEGHFFGNTANADFNNVGSCCEEQNTCPPGCVPEDQCIE